MLLVNPQDSFKVEISYRKSEKGEVEIVEESKSEKGVEHESAWFEFRRPNWSDVQTVMHGATGGGIRALDQIDGLAFMDAKVRTLLKSWSLKDEKGKTMPLTKMDQLPASVIVHLSAEIDKELGPNGLFGTTTE